MIARWRFLFLLAGTASGVDTGPVAQRVPAWVQRGMPGAGQAALAPLVGTWRARLSVYGTMGRSPICRRSFPRTSPPPANGWRTASSWRTGPRAQSADNRTGAGAHGGGAEQLAELRTVAQAVAFELGLEQRPLDCRGLLLQGEP
jgi:hypothetical protein